MKKRLGLMAIVLLALGVTACQTGNSSSSSVVVDGAVAKLQQAYDSLGALIPDPSNITSGFDVPVTLANGVTAEWSSDEPGVISFGTPANGFAVATVNRPAQGMNDAPVTISALLSLQSELSSEMLHQTWTKDLIVKQETVAELVIDNIDDILAITDKTYDGQLSVTLNDMTIFAKSAGEAFAYDGTGIIQVYAGAASTMVVGKVYTVSGTADWYYGIWEITKSTATEQVGATPNYPNKEAITSVTEKINALATAGEHLSALADASAGNFEPIYARVTGKIYKLPNDTSNYNTWIMDTTATEYVAGIAKTDTVAETPSNSLMVYYNTSDYSLVQQYNGIVVTMDVVIYTYRSNNHAFAVYYVGGPAGIEATLTDEQKLTIDANSLSLPSSITEATTLSLPTSGLNGSAIAWTSSHESVINPTTGAVTIPEVGVLVTMTATVTLGSLTAIVKTFKVVVGPLTVTTMADYLTKADGDVLYSEVEVLWASTSGSSSGKAFIVGDSTGYGYVYNSTVLTLTVGNFYGLNYTVDVYNGLYEMTAVSVLTAKGTDPNLVPTATAWTSTEVAAFDALTGWSPVYVSMELFGYADGSFVNAFLPGLGSRYIQTNGATAELAGKKFTATGWIIGRSSAKVTIQGTYTNAVDATDAEKLAVSVGFFKAPAANAAVTANITLPTTAKFGTVAWTSSNEAVISTTGVVTRPAEGQPDATVTLSYVITVGAESTAPVAIEFTVKAQEPVVVPSNSVTVSTLLSSVTSISQLTAGGTSGTAYTDATLSTFFTGASNKFASVTGASKVYPNEDTQAMKLGTSSAIGTFTVNMASGYVATKISVVFHAYKTNAATMTIAGGTETTATQSITAPTATDYTTGAATVELTSASGLSSFTIATTSTAYRAFIYSITVDYIAVV